MRRLLTIELPKRLTADDVAALLDWVRFQDPDCEPESLRSVKAQDALVYNVLRAMEAL